jgi:hypothetical protein
MKNLEDMTKTNRHFNVIPSRVYYVCSITFWAVTSPAVQYSNQAMKLGKQEYVQRPNSWT